MTQIPANVDLTQIPATGDLTQISDTGDLTQILSPTPSPTPPPFEMADDNTKTDCRPIYIESSIVGTDDMSESFAFAFAFAFTSASISFVPPTDIDIYMSIDIHFSPEHWKLEKNNY